MVHVPYKGAAPLTTDLIAGEIQMVAAPPSTFLPHVRTGKLKALAVASSTRSPLLPDVPTSAEAGLPGFEPSTWYAIVAPAGTPGSVMDRLNYLAASLVESEAGKRMLDSSLLEPMKMTSKEFAAFVLSETAVMQRVVTTTGMQPE